MPSIFFFFFILLTTTTLSTTATASSTTTLTATILSTLSFHNLSLASLTLPTLTTPLTIFAPTDTSLLTCPTCSIPRLLLEHSVYGLYTSHYLKNLPFATKLPTLNPNHCLTLTSTPKNTPNKRLFINGNIVTRPDLFNNGVLIVHAVEGYVTHLSEFSCNVQAMKTLTYPNEPVFVDFSRTMHVFLNDAMAVLRKKGYVVSSLGIRVLYDELKDLEFVTVFVIDDESIFVDGGAGQVYIKEMGFHVVPNRRLTGKEMVGLGRGTVFETLERGKKLVVTSAGGGGLLRPMRVNYEKVKRFGLVENERIAVHGILIPFRHVDLPVGDSRLAFSPAIGTE